MAGGWPSMALARMCSVMRNINVGLAGFAGAAKTTAWDWCRPFLWRQPIGACHAGCIRAHRQVMVDGIAGRRPLDAVYLDLHGAMVTEHLDDGEANPRPRPQGDRRYPAGRQPRLHAM